MKCKNCSYVILCSVLCVMELEHEYNELIYEDIYHQERCVYQKHKQDFAVISRGCLRYYVLIQMGLRALVFSK